MKVRLVSLLLASLLGCGDGKTSAASGAGGAPSTSAAGGDSSGAAPTMGGGGAGASGGAPSVGGGGSVPTLGDFPPEWPNGTSCGTEDPIFVWRLAPDTYVLRQSLCTSFEGPFLYLLFGEDRALLEDTGDGGIPLRETIDTIIEGWLAEQGKDSIELVVVHSHGHGDHVAGDGQLQDRPDTTVVGTSLSAVEQYFGLEGWPSETASLDLGGRVLDVVPIPGHQSAHVALYDPKYELLLTGDTLYPGRLYVQDFSAYVASVQRLVSFTQTHPVSLVLGTHVEMTNVPGVDFDFGADQHPNERPLQLDLAHLLELEAAVVAMGGSPEYEVHDDFIIYPL
jgi:hydroxyacylglutathione hydrolase